MGFERITMHPERMGGEPCIRDLRVTVTMVVGQPARVEQLLAHCSCREREDALAALEYAATIAAQRELALARSASGFSSTPTDPCLHFRY